MMEKDISKECRNIRNLLLLTQIIEKKTQLSLLS